MSGEYENGSPRQDQPAPTEHLNIKVTDNNNEIFFKIKRSTKLEKLMNAFCERQGKAPSSVRFLFEGSRVQPSDTPDTVRYPCPFSFPSEAPSLLLSLSQWLTQVFLSLSQLEMADGDTLEVHQEQVGGGHDSC